MKPATGAVNQVGELNCSDVAKSIYRYWTLWIWRGLST